MRAPKDKAKAETTTPAKDGDAENTLIKASSPPAL